MRNIVVRTTSQTPIYKQLYDQISSSIIEGELQPNDPLPSIRGFAKELRVSIITIKKVWELLESNGLIYTVKGKGSYIKENTTNILNQKKTEMVKKVLEESLQLCKEYHVPKEDLLELVGELYDEID